jgi:hypothetical protein
VQGSIDGVELGFTAQLGPGTSTLSFIGQVSNIQVGNLVASPSTFSITLGATLSLGPGEVNLGLLELGGSFSGTITVSLGTAGVSASVSGSASASLGVSEWCNVQDVAISPCGGLTDNVGAVSFNVPTTTVSVTSSGLGLSYDGHNFTLPW